MISGVLAASGTVIVDQQQRDCKCYWTQYAGLCLLPEPA
jgi:hypothetical protein